MQTKEQCQEKIAEMTHAVLEYLTDETNRLLRSGAIDFENREDNYRLPKVVLTMALENCAAQYRPRSWQTDEKKLLANLRHF